MSGFRRPVIYAARRAVEHAASLPGVRPLRLFPVIWPLWQLEIVANVEEPQAYQLLDRFIERCVVQGRLSAVNDIADFLGLHPETVVGCLRYLERIGHLTLAGDEVSMLPLGYDSVHEDVRYVAKESRQHLLFDRLTERPLPRSHYHGSVALLTRPRVGDDESSDRSRFLPLSAVNEFRSEILDELVKLPNRTEFNVPGKLSNVRQSGITDVFLPVYLIETTGNLLAYTAVADERDTYFEALCRLRPDLLTMVKAEPQKDPRTTWNVWMNEQRHRLGRLNQLHNGVWRAILPAGAFGEPPLIPVRVAGSFELRDNLFLQLWCDDSSVRRRAVLERAVRIAQTQRMTTRSALTTWAASLADLLEVTPVTFAEIRGHAKRDPDRLARVDSLE